MVVMLNFSYTKHFSTQNTDKNKNHLLMPLYEIKCDFLTQVEKTILVKKKIRSNFLVWKWLYYILV